MYAVLVDREDNSLVWSDVADPTAGPGEVVLDVHAAAVNRADLLQRQGKYPSPPGAPAWMGLEVSGVISAVGADVAKAGQWKVGDAACALLGGGGYAEQVAVDASMLLPVPAGLTPAEAASLPEVFATAWLNLVIEGELADGQTALIHAGASGVGIAAIQLAKLLGARVVTTVGSDEKAAAVRALGADVVANRHTDDLGAVLDRCVDEGRPVDVALDCVAGADLGEHLTRLAAGGRWIVIATLAGETATVNLRSLLNRGARLIGSKLRTRTPDVKAGILRALTHAVWPQIERARIRPVVHTVLPIGQAEAAHAILERCENIGKVVLAVRGRP
ncbi:MAG: NAD(P)H-quinone oxidoreductase [Planctomycetota bacterium]